MITAEKIINMRKLLGMTQDYLARIVELSPKTVYRWECGKALPRGSVGRKMKALEILVDNEKMPRL